MEKRHCVLISGFIRNYEDYLGQIKSNIITRDKIDVFLCLWDTINYSQDWHNGSYDSANRTPNSNTINVENIKKDFNPAVLKILKYSDYDTIFTESTNIFVNMNINYNNFIKNYQGNRKLVDRIKSKFKSNFSKFFILKKCFELVEEYSKQNNIEYINVCRIRSELGNPKYKGFYPVINWDKEYTELYIHDWCSTKRKNITKWCNWSGAHGNYKQMKIYCNIFSFLHLLNVKFDEFLCCFAKYGLFGQDKIWGDDMCTYLYLKHFNIPYLLCNGKNEESKNSLENKEFKEFNYMNLII